MYDTIHCYHKLDKQLDVTRFNEYRVIDDSVRGQSGTFIAHDLCHVRYMPNQNILSIQFSVASVLNEPYVNITEKMAHDATYLVDDYLKQFDSDLLPVREWTITRIDYAYNFVVDDIDSYMLMVRDLHHKYQRVQYDVSEGVLFSAKSRSIKFYNKAKQRGMGEAETTLRYEVSNYPAAVRYMAEHWFNCPRTVEQFLKPERAVYVLQRFWYELGLSSPNAFTHEPAIMYQLRETFGSSALAAHTALILISTHGSDAHKQQLLSRSQYYAWRHKLTQCGFLPYTQHTLPTLHLPTSILSSSADILKLFTQPTCISLRKILSENGVMM